MAQFLEGSPAVLNEQAPVRVLSSGSATIALGTKIVVVADARVTANSVIMCWGSGAADTTAVAFSVDVIVANTSFSIGSNANATAAKSVSYAVLQY